MSRDSNYMIRLESNSEHWRRAQLPHNEKGLDLTRLPDLTLETLERVDGTNCNEIFATYVDHIKNKWFNFVTSLN